MKQLFIIFYSGCSFSFFSEVLNPGWDLPMLKVSEGFDRFYSCLNLLKGSVD